MTLQDDIDSTIMEIFQEKRRTRRSVPAEAVGLSLPSARERLRKLDANGFITGDYATVDPKELGKEIFALIFVPVGPSRHYPQLPEQPHSRDEILE